MVLRPAGTNASFPKQVFGGNSPVPAGLLSSSVTISTPGSLAPLAAGPASGGPEARGVGGEAHNSDAPIWYPDYTTQQCDLSISERVPVTDVAFMPFLLTPGFGSPSKGKPNDMGFHPCGFVKFMVVCPEDIKHYKEMARKSCNRPACPVCWPVWAAREANRAAERVEGHAQAFKRYNKARHFSFSPPPYSVKTLDELMDKTHDVMKIAGVEAAAVIPHPYRLKHTDREMIPDRSWTNRYVEVLGEPTWRDHVRNSPHVHALVSGPLMDSKEFHEKTGWVYVNHDAYAHKRSLRGTLYYLLTHAWVNGNSRVIRYWFGMSTRALGKVELDPEYKTTPCPKCKTDCVKVDAAINFLTGEFHPVREDLHNCEVFRRKVRKWEYIEMTKVPK